MANHNNIQTATSRNTWKLPGTKTWWSSSAEYQSEMFDFMSHRFAKDSAALQEVGECRNWEDVSGVHSKWLNDMSNDYSAEGTKVMAIYTKYAANAAQERRNRH